MNERLRRWLDAAVGVPLSIALALLARKRPGRANVKRLLVIKLAAAGDTILLVPALRTLRNALPEARIDWLVSPVNLAIAQTVPYVDERIVWRGHSPLAVAALARRLRARRYDVVIDFEQWARGTGLLAFATGAPTRLGFDTPGQHRSALYTATVRKTYTRHEADEFLALAALLARSTGDPRLEVWETPEGREEVRLALPHARTGLRVVIHPGCGRDGLPREWPIERYAHLAKWLQEHYGAEIVLTSGPEETEKTATLNQLIGGHAFDLGGRLSWNGLATLLKQSDLLVSGNTGVMHLAAALGRPQVALHGPTNALLWGPRNQKARVVTTSCPQCPSLRLGFEYHRRDQACMSRIDIDSVKGAVAAAMTDVGRE